MENKEIGKRIVLTQKPVLIMNSSMEPPMAAETIAIFTYQSKNFIFFHSSGLLSRVDEAGRRPNLEIRTLQSEFDSPDTMSAGSDPPEYVNFSEVKISTIKLLLEFGEGGPE
ncbi:hypothetical protein DM860_002469 [Cuscuta australis]|uniref:Uncharacterized protein n=1 Tax=Cuscuta australis TaxID=267555 RepID=A0A328D231_9ASTE|nr:hypothetical protein DM860_002469 [Cuscuta australis]